MTPSGAPPTWFEDEAAFADAVRDALRDVAPVPRIAGLEDLREIGRGGQGVVYRAVQAATRREVAVKVLLDAPGRTRSARQRFAREIELVASLHDPRLVQVFDGGATEDGRPFIVMELVEGVRIDECPVVVAARAAGFARPAADAALALFAEVCGGIDHAHRRGVIHRDLKPSNILVDVHGVPRVLDFGLAKAAGLAGEGFETTAGARFVGSLPWTSPEQALGKLDAVDVRSDVYALGATLYQIATGRPPVPVDADLRRALDAVVKDPPVAPAKLDGRCDRDLEAVILRALEKDPERRYATAGDLARDLRRLLANEPIEARRETAWRALTKLAHRRRRLAIGSMLVAVVAAGIVVMTWSLWRRAEAESSRASAESARAQGALDFFLDSIASVDPARDGADAKLADALDRVSADLDRRIGDADPAARLRFRMRLRDLYLRFGRYDRGLAEAEAVERLTAGSVVPGTPEFRSRWNGETIRALALYRLGRAAEALAVYRAAEDALVASFGERDADALGARAGRAQVLKAQGKLDEAEAALRTVLAATEGATTREAGAFARATACDNLAAIAEMRGNAPAAEAPQREAVQLFTLVFGEDAPEALTGRSNLGNLFLTLGRTDDAVATLTAVAAAFRKRSGERHPSTLTAEHNLGVAFLRGNRLDEASPLLEQVLQRRGEVLGKGAHETLLTLNEVAMIADRRGQTELAERLCTDLAAGRRALAAQHPLDYWNALSNLASVLRDHGKLGDALRVYEELVPAAQRVLGEGHWMVARFSAAWGSCLSAAGRFDEAAQKLTAAAAILAAKYGEQDRETASVRAAIARNAQRQSEAATRPSR